MTDRTRDDDDDEFLGFDSDNSSSGHQTPSHSSMVADESSTTMRTPDSSIHEASESTPPLDDDLSSPQELLRQSQPRTAVTAPGSSTTSPQNIFQGSSNPGLSSPTGDNADWELVIGIEDDAPPFRVSSQKIKNASEKLYAALWKTRQENMTLQDLPIKLPDEDVAAFKIVMHICHLRPDRCPRTINFQTLHHLADLADRYKLSVLLKASIRSWLLHLSDYQVDLEDKRWLLTSWTFGMKAVFYACLEQEIQNGQIDDDGQLSKADAQACFPSTCGVVLADYIVRQRRERLRSLHDLLKTFYDYDFYRQKHTCEHWLHTDRDLCRHERYGAFCAEVGCRKLLGSTFEKESINHMLAAIFRMSPQRMMKLILASPRFTMTMLLDIDDDEIQQEEDYDDHAECGHEGLRDAVAELISNFSECESLLEPFAEQFAIKVVEDEAWGSGLAEGTNNSTCFVAGDILNVTSIQLRTTQPQKRTIEYKEDPQTGVNTRKRLRMNWDYREGAEEGTPVPDEDGEDDETDSDYEAPSDVEVLDPDADQESLDQGEQMEDM